MDPASASSSAGQMAGGANSYNQASSGPGVARGSRPRVLVPPRIGSTPNLRSSYDRGRYVLGFVRSMPRQVQLRKLRHIQQKILQLREERLADLEDQLERLQDAELGMSQQLHEAYKNRDGEPSHVFYASWLQRTWLRVNTQVAKCRAAVLRERARMAIQRAETLSQFEARLFVTLGYGRAFLAANPAVLNGIFNSHQAGSEESSNISNNLLQLYARHEQVLQSLQVGPPMPPANPFQTNGFPRQGNQAIPQNNPSNTSMPNWNSEQMEQMILRRDLATFFASNGTSQNGGQMMAQGNMSNHPTNRGQQQVHQIMPHGNLANGAAYNGMSQRMGQMTTPRNMSNHSTNRVQQQVHRTVPHGSLANGAGHSGMSQMMDQIAIPPISTRSLGPGELSQRIEQMLAKNNATNAVEPINDSQPIDRLTLQNNLANFLPSYSTPQQMEPRENLTSPSTQPSEDSSGSNNAAFPADLQLPTMDSQGPPDWFMPVEDPTNNANNPTLSSSLGAGTKLAQAVRDLEGQGDQLALPGTGDEPFDIERFLNDRRAKQLPTKMEGIDEDRENQDAKTEQGNDGMNYEDDDTLSESERID